MLELNWSLVESKNLVKIKNLVESKDLVNDLIKRKKDVEVYD